MNWSDGEFVPASTCSFITPLVGLLGDAGVTGTAATIGAGVLQGAAGGAGLAALTGGKIGTGALIGGGLGGVLAGVGGIGGVGAGSPTAGTSLGGAAPTLGTLSDGTVLGAPTADEGNMLLDDEGAPLTDANGNTLYASTTGNATTASDGSAINPVSQAAAATTGAGTGGAGRGALGALGGGGGISNTALGLGALAALGSAMSKPAVGTWATPGPNSVQQGPYYNAPLNTNVAGRTTSNPFITGTGPTANGPPGTPANYWNYGSGPQTYFGNNSLQSYGFADGGPLSLAHGGKEFTTDHGEHHVRGPGSGTADKVPAALSNKEYVLTYDDVARLGMLHGHGHGDPNEEGAKFLDHARKGWAREVGQPQFPPKKLGRALNEQPRSRGNRP